MAGRLQDNLSAKASEDLVREVDAVAERMRHDTPGCDATRSDAVRYLILRGLAADRAERST